MTNGSQPPSMGATPRTAQTSGLATASLVLGILSLFCLGPITAIPAVICGHMAKSKIRQSGGALSGEGMALAGLVIGYLAIVLTVLAVVVLGMGTAAAVPAIKEAQQKAEGAMCVNNLHQIQIAKQMWQLEFDKEETATPTWNDLATQLPTMREGLQCPQGGEYAINAVGEPPTCSIPGHELSMEE